METAILYGKEVKIGDLVQTVCDRDLSAGGKVAITNIGTRYDQNNGNAYKVIYLEDWIFDSRTGRAVNSPTAYYIAKN